MKTVLVVEDSKAQQLLVAGLLKAIGVEVIVVDNGQDALGWLTKNTHPDLILMDIVMPDISGFDLCRQIRTELHMDTTPIIFCSQKNQDSDRFWALRQGGTDYVTKPFSPTELVNTVKQYL